MAEQQGTVIDCTGKAWDVVAASFYAPGDVALIGMEITDMDGRLSRHAIGIFCICQGEGTKAFLSPATARDFAAQLLGAADQLEAGATSLAVN